MFADLLGLCPNDEKCTAARALIGQLGAQISSAGKTSTWAGVGLIGLSGAGALLAPEAAPAEVVGAEEGASLIEVGSWLSRTGDTLQGYAKDGVWGAGKAAFISTLTDFGTTKASEFKTLFQGASETNQKAIAGLLGKITDAFQDEEEACGSK